MSDLIDSKICPDCGELKPAMSFGANKRLPDGLARYCKECFRARSKASYRKRMAEQGRRVRERVEVDDGYKRCPRCGEIKPISAFGRNRAKKSGLTDYCRPCHGTVMAANKAKIHGSTRNYLLKRRYGLTEDEVAALAERHGELCLICLHRRPLHVDHDHVTGEIRGLLCFGCNGALGQFRDDPNVIRRAVDYLEGRVGAPFLPKAGSKRVRGDRKPGRHYRLMRRYGIGLDDFQHLVERQGGVCPICRMTSPAHVDHDHVTGAVRGILCADCNTGMGQLRDDPWILRRAIEYLAGGLAGLRLTGTGDYEVTTVRPRRSAITVDPGWELGRACTDDLALLHALAHGDRPDPWETDVTVADPEWSRAWAAPPAVDDADLLDRDALPSEPLGPPEHALTPCG